MRCTCERCCGGRYQVPPSPNPIMGRGMDAAYAERAMFYRQLAREIGLSGPDYNAAAAYVAERYGGR